MPSAAELVDQGISAYLAGKVPEAVQALRKALVLEPGNLKARSYLLLIQGLAPTPVPGSLATVASAPAATRAAPTATARAAAPAVDEDAIAIDTTDFAPSPWDEGRAAVATIVVGSEGGLDLDAVAEKSGLRPLVPEAPPPAARKAADHDVEVWMAAARDLFALGDFSGSLEMIEKILQVDPEHDEARRYLAQNETTLVAMYESKLAPLTRVPRLAIKPEEVMWLNLDHRAGFLLAQIDGAVDFDALFALSGLPRLDTARILATLIADGVITG